MIDAKDVNGRILYSDESHQFVWLGADPDSVTGVVQTNQYLIIDNGRGILLDPGGVHLFSRTVAVVSHYISLDKIDTILFSHQDPDVSSGIGLWLGICSAKIYISSLWLRFLPHFGLVDQSRVLGVENSGKALILGSGARIDFVPAHFLHSPGQFNYYDERSRILFTGDIGAAVFPEGRESVFVEDFNANLPYIEPFHRRFMASRRACEKWCSIVRGLDPEMIAPQHGGIYKGEALKAFLAWLSRLECGVDQIDSLYGA
jgi:flavorubredoxin